jgi:hypothetical protein
VERRQDGGISVILLEPASFTKEAGLCGSLSSTRLGKGLRRPVPARLVAAGSVPSETPSGAFLAEEQSPANGAATARPTIGPVVPLSANGGSEGGVLLGAASHPPEREADPLATRMLNRGEPSVAPISIAPIAIPILR